MKPRNLVDLVDPDHLFKVTSRSTLNGFRSDDDGIAYTYSCTCGYRGTYVSTAKFAAEHPEVNNERVQMWVSLERLEHLLDQEIHNQDVVQLLKESR